MTADPTSRDVVLPVNRTTGDTLAERMTEAAYEQILPARYLQTDETGEPVEHQDELFDRVAKNVALAEVVHQTDAYHEDDINALEWDDVVPYLDEADRSYISHVADQFRGMMEHLAFIPNSPTLMNAGTDLQQLSACFVMSPEDDISDIHQTAKEAAEVFQSGGGVGYAFWQLRPYGDSVGSTGGIASGPITFMRTYDQLCETIAQGGKRRGAQMAVMRVSHPDVIEFIHAKNKDVSLAHTLKLNDPDDYTYTSFAEALDEARELIDDDGRVPKHLRNAVEGHLSNFNISVGVTDAFMDAVNADDEYTFTNPRTGAPHIATDETAEMYARYDLEEYVTVGEPLTLPARVVWDRIVTGAHENGEPGVVFLERMNAEHSFDVDEHPEYQMLATNPCGEQPLMENESCNLGHINLSTIVDDAADERDWRDWQSRHASYDGDGYHDLEADVATFLGQAIDWDEFDDRIHWATRFLDNVVTMSDFPVEAITDTVRDNRKIGLGIMGLAQLYVQLGVRYGSEVGNEIARQLMRHINHEAKWTSHLLADTRGAFPNWADSKYADPVRYREWFEHQTGLVADEWTDGFPIRNHNVTTIAPTGTCSMLADTSGGCEPIYNVAYYKNVTDDVQGDEMLVEFDSYFLRTLEANDIDVDSVKAEAAALMADNAFDGVTSLDTVPDAIGELFVTTDQVTAEQHAAVQCACQEGVDSAISKTVNAPSDATREDTRRVFEWVYDNGGKGVTYYRDGTRSKQVLTTRADNAAYADDADSAAELHDVIDETFGSLDAFLDRLGVSATANAETLAAEVIETEPRFAEKRPRPAALAGVSQRIETGYGKVYVTINADPETGEPFELFANIGHSGGFTNSFTEALAKTISVALRSGVDPDELAGELCGTRSPKVSWDRAQPIQSIPDAIGRALRRYLDDDLETTTRPTVPVEGADGPAVEPETDGGGTALESAGAPPRGAGDATDELIAAGESPECADCGSMSLYYVEGCKTCQNCGFSECG